MSSPLIALSQRVLLPHRCAVIVAHPDDESIALGGLLHLLPNVILIHVTDGAPRSRADADGYRATRRTELAAALHAARTEATSVTLDIPDQEASYRLAELIDQLTALFLQHHIALVFTHPYEGGHPDHDATACAVHRAASAMATPPTIIEAPFYHAGPNDRWRLDQFLGADQGCRIALDAVEQARKQAMFMAHASQHEVLRMFGTDAARFRHAPAYDFAQPPHPGPLLYERYAWGMTGKTWRDLAAAA